MTPMFQELLDAGAHFGHLKRKWNPAMAPYIYMERNGIHIIDLNKTEAKLNEACAALRQMAKSGKKVLFVATKKQAKEIVAELVAPTQMPFITERWSGGMLTNFSTIRKTVSKMTSLERMATDGTFENISKREKLQIGRQREKLHKLLGSISEMNKLPAALFVVDVSKEHIAVKEAKLLGIPVFGIVDTNSKPDIDFVIPANDDASKSIHLIVSKVIEAIQEGLSERKSIKDAERSANDAAPQGAETSKEPRAHLRPRRGSARKADDAPEANAPEADDSED